MKSRTLWIALLAIRLAANAQIQSGSIVVVTSSKDEIVVAADSRRIVGQSYVDTGCKIAALGNKLIFAAVGNTGLGPPNGRASWDAQTLARNEFVRLEEKHATHDWTLDLAKAWGNATKIKVQESLTRSGKTFLAGLDGNEIMSAAFAGFGKEGDVSLIRSVIAYRTTKHGFLATNNFEPVLIAPGEQKVLGEGEIAAEIGGSSPTAAQLRQEAEADAKSGRWTDPGVFWAIETVKLTIKHHVGKMKNGRIMSNVGGKIDAVSLSRSNGIHWIQRKDNCPAD